MRAVFRASILPSPIALLLACSSIADAQDAGRRVTIEDTRSDNVYVAGGTIDVFGQLEKDLVAAGGTVSVGRLVKRDVTVAGGAVHLGGVVGEDVRAAGGLVTVGSRIGGELVAAGGEIVLDRKARVAGRAWLAGRTVIVNGQVGRGLRVAGGTVTLEGQIDGDVNVVAQSVALLPGARITGNLSYASGAPARIDPGAQILGRVTREPAGWAPGARRAGRFVFRVVKIVAGFGLLATGVVLLLVFPGATRATSRTIASVPWRSLGVGVLLLVANPIVAILLMVTIVGIPLGLLTIAFYLASLLLGFLVGAIFLGDLLARLARRREPPPAGLRILGLLLALVVLALLGLVPVVGGAIQLVTLLVGLGALALHAHHRYSGHGENHSALPPTRAPE
jgi:hypothetical protein